MSALLSLNNYHYRRGGSDVVYLEHEAMFREMGWDTAHMSMSHPKNMPSVWSKFFVDEIEFGEAYSIGQKIEMAGKVIYSFEARRKLESLLESFSPDVAHVHCIYHHLSPSVLSVLKERGVPVVLTAHDLKIACPAYKMLNDTGVCEKCKGGNLLHLVSNRCIRSSLVVSSVVAIESAVSKMFGLYRKNVSRVVAPSRFYKRKLEEWGWSSNQIDYIPNYVRSERYVPNYAAGDYFLFFGRLAPEKGVATLIRAALHTGVRLKIAGGGPLEAELKALGAAPNIEFVGFKSGDELWSLVKESRAVVLPSEWYENAPMSVLESFALGKPVVGANIGGIPELIQDGVTGWVFESGNVSSLASVLDLVCSMSDSGVAEVGMAARDFVSSQYSASRYSESMLSLYSDLRASSLA